MQQRNDGRTFALHTAGAGPLKNTPQAVRHIKKQPFYLAAQMSFLEPYLAHGPMVGSYGTSAIELICAEEPTQPLMADSPEMLPHPPTPMSPFPPPSEENLSLEHPPQREPAPALALSHSHSQPLPALTPSHSQPLPAPTPSHSQPLPALTPSHSQPAPSLHPSKPAPRAPFNLAPAKKKFASDEIGNGWEEIAAQYLERKLKQPAEDESGEMLALRGTLPNRRSSIREGNDFFSKTHALLYSLLDEQEEEEIAQIQTRETNV
ncbi:hypothetical protein ElyMa_006988700 [Elysia marginata]|uniref:Uncharacterized protein n=1 Tax=Elysia marginata TaxID=1093978 RepID=A0AAV4JTJ6_9GAST|nr:hypothetical protein ElyMa_006988700 [Elysia marginata]